MPVDLIFVLFIRPSPVNNFRFYVRLNLGIIFNVAWVSVLQTLLCFIIVKFIPAWYHVLGRQRRVALPLEFFPLSILSFQFYLMHVVEEILPHRHVLSLDYVHVNLAFVNWLEICDLSLFNNWLKTAAFYKQLVNQSDKRTLLHKYLNLSYYWFVHRLRIGRLASFLVGSVA